jgi:uncharacterized protein YhbP (UPF0306 family)
MTARLKILAPRKFRSAEVAQSMQAILSDTCLFAMATVNSRDTPHVNNAFFFVEDDFRLGFLSFPNTRHIRNVIAFGQAAVSVAQSKQMWGRPIRGVQLFGQVRKAQALQRAAFFKGYAARFAASRRYCRELLNSTPTDSAAPFYFEIQRFTIIDEIRFGEEVYVRGVIQRGKLGK